MAIAKLLTEEGRNLDKNAVLQEYPRPQFYRDSYINLNGEWDYAIRKRGEILRGYDGKILVPFSPETILSGVGDVVLQPDETLYYKRTFTLPEGFVKGCTLLHFGAVDYACEVKVNGKRIGSHKNGYLPFYFDISEALVEGENLLEVAVTDPTETGCQARGKQIRNASGIWYTPTSGIWQTVWIESLPLLHLEKVRLTPIFEEDAVKVEYESSDDAPIFITLYKGSASLSANYYNESFGEEILTADVENGGVIHVPDAIHWTPENPHLYIIKIKMGEDEVVSYFGIRKFSVGFDKKGVSRLMLNDKPCFHKGVLDQGYWSDGLYTACSDSLLIKDIAVMKDMGFNMLRKHIKIEPMRWYFHCDRMGMLVWQDMVSGGDKPYSPLPIMVYPGLGVAFCNKRLGNIDDGPKNYKLFRRASQEGREEYYEDMYGTMAQLINVVSLAMWVPFNEGWGQFDSLKAAAMVRAYDPTRLIDHASGWHDKGGPDVNSFHIYFTRYKFPKLNKEDNRPIALTEFGGYSYAVKGHTWDEERIFGYRVYKTAEKLEAMYKKLFDTKIIPQVETGLSAIVYTQVSDVEMEINGLMTFDRSEIKIPVETVKALNDQLVIED